MPLFSYECSDCTTSFQTLVRSGETPVCPSCGGVHLDQQLSLPAEHAKGAESAGKQAAPQMNCHGEAGPSCGMCPGMAA